MKRSHRGSRKIGPKKKSKKILSSWELKRQQEEEQYKAYLRAWNKARDEEKQIRNYR